MRFDRRKFDAGRSQWADRRHSFSSTVPRELVHRRAISEVFMTDIRRIGEGRYLATAQWPRLHPFFCSRPGAYDTALIAESLRQATILVAHAMEGVPLGQVFLMPDMSVQALGGHAGDPGTPTEVNMLLDVNVSQRNSRGPVVFRVEARFDVGGHPIATGAAGARLVDPASYARLRLRSATDGQPPQTVPLPPEQVGHRFSHNVAIGAGGPADTWPLHVDGTNPTFFDHPLDHVPGLLMVEGIRQALRVRMTAPDLDFQAFEASFLKIVELDDDASVSLRTVVIEDQVKGWATAAISVDGAVCVELSCRFTLNAPNGPRQDLPHERPGGQDPGTQPVWSREPSPARGSTTCPRSAPAHQHDA
ncbi:hypothetical protein QFZ30_003624 [Arthrobacter pascens]|nr:hypothetical protein [Arthrobacter pascens]